MALINLIENCIATRKMIGPAANINSNNINVIAPATEEAKTNKQNRKMLAQRAQPISTGCAKKILHLNK